MQDALAVRRLTRLFRPNRGDAPPLPAAPGGLPGAFESLIRLSWTLRRKPMEAFLQPTALLPARGGATLVCRDGSLCTLFALDGGRRAMGAGELDALVALASDRLAASFIDPGHALHLVFERDPDAAGDAAREAAGEVHRAGRRLGLDLADLAGERARRLAELLAPESATIAAWTRPSALPAAQARRDKQALAARLASWPPAADEAQCPVIAEGALAPRHAAFRDSLAGLFREAGLVARPLDTAEAARRIRVLAGGGRATARDWRPVTAANEGPPRDTEPSLHGAFPPPLAPQLIAEEPGREGAALRLGGRLYRPLDMALGPRHERPFADLLSRCAEAGLPFRLSILIEGGGLSGWRPGLTRTAAALLAIASSDSLAVRDAMRALAERRAAAEPVVRLRAGLLTWADAEAGEGGGPGSGPGGGPGSGEAVAERRLARLRQLAEGWGEAAWTPYTGDVLESFIATVPGFCCGATAEPALAPLDAALRLLPLSRPAPLARNGHPFRDAHGKHLPLGPGEADFGFELIHGRPGHGKSVLMNNLNLAHLLQEGQVQLPALAIVDIGPSAAGLIDLLRDALPAERRHEAARHKFTNTTENAINPMDTQLGCRSPLPAERGFIANLLALILTPAGDQAPPDGLREAIGPALDAAYRMRADKRPGAEPHPYAEGHDDTVDRALADAGVHLPERALWWDVVDRLFDAGEAAAAARAQRYAVPVLTDLLASLRDDAVQALIGRTTHGSGGESVTEAFTRVLTALSGEWPAMFAPTRVEPEARVAAIDLAEVAPQGSADADRQAAAFYLLARHALTRSWWIEPESLAAVNEPYRSWHATRLAALAETPKRLCYDEYHRTAGTPAVRGQVERDVREARKRGVRLCVASQRLEDFGEALVELASRRWILGAGGTRQESEALDTRFGLSETLRQVLRRDLTGPGPRGAPALLLAESGEGRTEQLLYNTPGPVELWALTTAPADTALRRRLTARLGPAAARAALAAAFPEGSARRRLAAERARDPDIEEAARLDAIADEIAGRGNSGGNSRKDD